MIIPNDKDLQAPWIGKCREDYYEDWDETDEDDEFEYDRRFDTELEKQ